MIDEIEELEELRFIAVKLGATNLVGVGFQGIISGCVGEELEDAIAEKKKKKLKIKTKNRRSNRREKRIEVRQAERRVIPR